MLVLAKNKKIILIISVALCTQMTHAQKLSIDAAVVRNATQDLKGINTALFYHFTEKFSGGAELTRLYKRIVRIKDEQVERSAWDIDLNLHYDVLSFKKLNLYPIVGVGYNELKERNKQLNETVYDKYWAVNTGAGIRLDAGILKPHIEYTAVWAGGPEHILLAGISYEFGIKKKNSPALSTRRQFPGQ